MKQMYTPTLGASSLLTGGSGGRPRWSAATAEPLHTLWLQPNEARSKIFKKLSIRTNRIEFRWIRRTVTFGSAKQGLSSKPQKCLDPGYTRWDLLLYERAYLLADTE